MTNAVITWIEKETGILKTDITALTPEVIAWAKNFLSTITPVVIQAAENAVAAAVTVPGGGAVKAAAALASATLELTTAGVPIIENDLKAAIQVAYNNLPASVASTPAAADVVAAANNEVATVGAEVAADATKAVS